MGQFEGLKEFDVAALGRNAMATTGQPRELPIARIEPDPDNIRRYFDEESIDALSKSIKVDGLLQPITVRRNVHKKDFFLISYGGRRYRAVCLLGYPTIAAIINDQFDPYRQAIENIEREDLHPLDFADWIQKRKEAGDTLAKIAERLNKPKSYISEIAQLIGAPALIREALRTRRISDVRTAYQLTRRFQRNPALVTTWLQGAAPITRRLLASVGETERPPSPLGAVSLNAEPHLEAAPWNSLTVQVAEREGTMSLKPGDLADQATIRFTDGSLEAVALSKIRLKTWTVL